MVIKSRMALDDAVHGVHFMLNGLQWNFCFTLQSRTIVVNPDITLLLWRSVCSAEGSSNMRRAAGDYFVSRTRLC